MSVSFFSLSGSTAQMSAPSEALGEETRPVSWMRRPQTVIRGSAARTFAAGSGSVMNLSGNLASSTSEALDAHVAGDGARRLLDELLLERDDEALAEHDGRQAEAHRGDVDERAATVAPDVAPGEPQHQPPAFWRRV
jgi:hypothetical protein